MKKLLIISMIAVYALLSFSLPLCAQLISDETKDALITASPAKKSEIVKMIEKDYPDFGKDTFLYLAGAYPNFTTRLIRNKLNTLKGMDGKTLASLYLEVSKDMEGKYSEPRKEFRGYMRTLVTEKYPGIVEDMKSFGESSGFRVKMASQINEKYPHFRSDCLKVIREKHPGLLLTVGRDALSTIIVKDPTLLIDLKLEVTELMESQFPELLKVSSKDHGTPKIAGLRNLMRENPKFVLALMDKVDSKFSKRINEVKHALIADLLEKHSEELLTLTEDLVTMIEKNYPELPKEAVLTAIECRKGFKKEVRDTHRDFFNDIISYREKNFPALAKDLLTSVDAHQPALRKNMSESMKKEFPDLDKNLKSFGDKKFPDLERHIKDILK